MDIVVGIDNITSAEELRPLADAGADEFYVGYFPPYWSDAFGWELAPNRRPYKTYNYTSLEDLSSAVTAIKSLGKKALLAINEHEYPPERMNLAVRMAKETAPLDFDGIIISNIAVAIAIRKEGINTPFHISIGGLANNYEAIRFYSKYVPGIRRFILPRDVTVGEIKSMAQKAKKDNISLEVFGIGDPCAWSDGYCLTWHSSCTLPFCSWFLNGKKKVIDISRFKNWREKSRSGNNSFLFEKNKSFIAPDNFNYFAIRSEKDKFLGNIVRSCGLCAVPLFKKWGINVIKVPARGGALRSELISLVKKAMELKSPDECRRLIGSRKFCSGSRCYYNYPSEKNA